MEATAARAKHGTKRGGRTASDPAATDVSTAFERCSADVYEIVRGLVDDPEKANRIAQVAFIASCQALAAGADTRPNEMSSASVEAAAATNGVCPKLGYADNSSDHYSRPTQLHRCYAAGEGG